MLVDFLTDIFLHRQVSEKLDKYVSFKKIISTYMSLPGFQRDVNNHSSHTERYSHQMLLIYRVIVRRLFGTQVPLDVWMWSKSRIFLCVFHVHYHKIQIISPLLHIAHRLNFRPLTGVSTTFKGIHCGNDRGATCQFMVVTNACDFSHVNWNIYYQKPKNKKPKIKICRMLWTRSKGPIRTEFYVWKFLIIHYSSLYVNFF